MQLSDYLKERRSTKPVLVMTHVVCGYPSFEDNWRELEIMAEFGVDLVELQFPFSEPSADGPLFVKANQVSLANGTTVDDCLEFMSRVAAHFPFKVLMMGYYNTAFKMGHEAYIERLAEAGASGFILPDLPLEESAQLHKLAADNELAPIMLMTPTNSPERLALLGRAAKGFVYAVARKGVTGSETSMDDELIGFLDSCKAVIDVPLAVGFGVSRKSDIEFIGKHADIAIIGTAALRAWEEGREDALRTFFSAIGI